MKKHLVWAAFATALAAETYSLGHQIGMREEKERIRKINEYFLGYVSFLPAPESYFRDSCWPNREATKACREDTDASRWSNSIGYQVVGSGIKDLERNLKLELDGAGIDKEGKWMLRNIEE